MFSILKNLTLEEILAGIAMVAFVVYKVLTTSPVISVCIVI